MLVDIEYIIKKKKEKNKAYIRMGYARSWVSNDQLPSARVSNGLLSQPSTEWPSTLVLSTNHSSFEYWAPKFWMVECPSAKHLSVKYQPLESQAVKHSNLDGRALKCQVLSTQKIHRSKMMVTWKNYDDY